MATIYKLFLIALSLLKCHGSINNYRYYPRYHLAPPGGWMNDPNGFCFFGGEYHLFYQYNPLSSSEPGIANWGHAKSNDLFHWIDLGIAIKPGDTYDKDGVFSGSAVVDENTMYLFYTGNVNSPAKQVQALAVSSDGINVQKDTNNPIIEGDGLQPHIRDPKVWKHGNKWYMVLGNSLIKTNADGEETGEKEGRVLLFTSSDRRTWNQESVFSKAPNDIDLGYMWECPDFFEIGGRFVLLFSPQGIEPDGDKFQNKYQTGYIVGTFDYDTNTFTPETKFKELDFGHDFYATQTMLDSSGRRLLVAWMDMWDASYPQASDGFTGQMTIVRTLSLTEDGQLVQKPVAEINSLRSKTLFASNSFGGTVVTLGNKAGEVFVVAPVGRKFELYIDSDELADRVTILYDHSTNKVSLQRPGSGGLRRTDYTPQTNLILRVFIDASSIELFLGEGEVTFSSRFFPKGPVQVRLSSTSVANFLVVNEFKSTLYLRE